MQTMIASNPQGLRAGWVNRRSMVLATVALIGVGLGIRYLVGLYRLAEVDSAILVMRRLYRNQQTRMETHPLSGYSCELEGVASDLGLIKGQKNSYVFGIEDCRGGVDGGPIRKYKVTARPLHDGMPAFCSDESGILRVDQDGSTLNCIKNGAPY